MIDLSTNPFNLNDEQIQKVTKICNDMTLDEKIGQIFCPIGNVQDEKEIDEFIQKYKPGAMMYRPLPSKEIKRIHCMFSLKDLEYMQSHIHKQPVLKCLCNPL